MQKKKQTLLQQVPKEWHTPWGILLRGFFLFFLSFPPRGSSQCERLFIEQGGEGKVF